MSSYNQMKGLLKETTSFMGKHGAHPISDFQTILAEDSLFDLYSNSLSEGLSPMMKEEFDTYSQQVRNGLLAETVYGFNPVAPLVMPIFRRMWPQLVVREALTVMPMDKPEIVHAFLMAVARVGNTEYELPNINQPVSTAQPFGDYTVDIPPFSLAVPAAVDVLGVNGFTSATAHLARDIVIVGAVRADGTSEEFYAEPDDDGNFSFDVQCGAQIDFVHGNIDYFNGIISVSSTRQGEAGDKVASITVVGSISQAEEMIAPRISFKHVKIRLNAIDHEVQAEWTIQYEQDVKAYFGATRSIIKSYSIAA